MKYDDQPIPGWIHYTDEQPRGLSGWLAEYPEYLIRDTPENRRRIKDVHTSHALGWGMLAVIGAFCATALPVIVPLGLDLASAIVDAGGGAPMGAREHDVVIASYVLGALSVASAVAGCTGLLMTIPRQRAARDVLVYGGDAQRLGLTARLGLYETKGAVATETGKKQAAKVADAASAGVAGSVLARIYTNKRDERLEKRAALVDSFLDEW
ncbi:hypothetical protein ACTXL6_22075 [Brachybacterium tyrofermentans]|uniref:hypothetical protein n=1 Tax=Brachybacterium tyrofermentans TaxID=47848 RepID=UPI003FCFC569